MDAEYYIESQYCNFSEPVDGVRGTFLFLDLFVFSYGVPVVQLSLTTPGIHGWTLELLVI